MSARTAAKSDKVLRTTAEELVRDYILLARNKLDTPEQASMADVLIARRLDDLTRVDRAIALHYTAQLLALSGVSMERQLIARDLEVKP